MASWAYLIERRRVEFHDGVSNGLLFDALVQGFELSPELHQIAAAWARVRVHASCRCEDVFGEGSNELDNNLQRAIRTSQR